MMQAAEIDELIAAVDAAATDDFVELAKIARLDPQTDFRYANLQGVDFSGSDLRPFDFTGAAMEDCTFRGTLIEGARFDGATVDIRRLQQAADWTAYLQVAEGREEPTWGRQTLRSSNVGNILAEYSLQHIAGPRPSGFILDGVEKLQRSVPRLSYQGQARSLQNFILAIAEDTRILPAFLASHLHLLRTIGQRPANSRKRTCEETLWVYAPLAGRLGLQSMREEMEELAFRWGYPDAYKSVTDDLAKIRNKNPSLVEETIAAIKAKLSQAVLSAEVSGREKKPFSVWRKMKSRGIGFNQISDCYGFRIIVEKAEDCYRVLGLIHNSWRSVPSRFKDYISSPKKNEYQALHTTIIGPHKQRLELQIRSRDMHDNAEYGQASIVADGDGAVSNEEAAAYARVRRIIENMTKGVHSGATRLQTFGDRVFCISPKGRLIVLPNGSIPLDFAYAIHTDVGNACMGAVINGRQLPLTTQLKNGDQVEIVMAKGHTPPAAWDRIVKTGKARSGIRRAARDAQRRQQVELGRRLLMAAFGRIGVEYSDENVKKALATLSNNRIEQLECAVGRGGLTTDKVIERMNQLNTEAASAVQKRKLHQRPRAEDGWFSIPGVNWFRFRSSDNDTLPNKLARKVSACDPKVARLVALAEWAVPGDFIIGILGEDPIVAIFQADSPTIKDVPAEKRIEVSWDIEEPERFPARIAVTALNDPAALSDITTAITAVDGDVDSSRVVRRAEYFTEMDLQIDVWSAHHLAEIIAAVGAKSVVTRVDRVFRKPNGLLPPFRA